MRPLTLAPESAGTATTSRRSWATRAAAALFMGRLEQLDAGMLTLRDAGLRRVFGTAGRPFATATLTVHDPRFYRRVAARGCLGAALSYADRDWSSDDLPAMLRIFARGMSVADRLDRGPGRAGLLLARLKHALRRNSRLGSRRNIADHYDLSNAFFKLWLDPTMTYSAGVFEHAGMSLQAAQEAKLDRLCRKLDLGPDDHLLEIGTGWGGLAVHAASHFGCRVTTTTISAEQHRVATARVRAAGLADRVEVLLEDYRDLEGQYDKLVSVEMIEAVGHQYLPTFFRVCSERLRPHGRMALQAITVPDQRFEAHKYSADFIQQVIFPGSCCPSLGAVTDALARGTDLRVTHTEDIGTHYAETLARWREAFMSRGAEVRALGFDETFRRTWEYYLAYCEAGFAERYLGCLQLVLDKPRNRDSLPLMRWDR